MIVIVNDLKKRWGKWQGFDGLLYMHRQFCGELPDAYEQLSEEARVELFAAFELTNLREFIRTRESHP